MLRGEVVGLRARHDADIAILHAEFYDDIATRSRADARPWRPLPPDSPASPFAVTDPTDSEACFSVVELATEDLGGDGLL